MMLVKLAHGGVYFVSLVPAGCRDDYTRTRTFLMGANKTRTSMTSVWQQQGFHFW